MAADARTSYENLFSALQKHKSSLHLFPRESYSAILKDAFKNGIEIEPIWDGEQCIAYEALARPKDQKGKEFSIGLIAEELYKARLHYEFDVFTVANALRYAKDETLKRPLTTNASPLSILNPRYMEQIQERMNRHGYRADDIIFEILEHDVDTNADIGHLYELKDQGFRFALDDLSNSQGDKNRLALFGGLVDFIKIDGPFVRAFFEGRFVQKDMNGNPIKIYKQNDLGKLLDSLPSSVYDATLIAERVRTVEEADELTDMGICVQGRDLKFAQNGKLEREQKASPHYDSLSF